jgi:hypothetical protein
VRGGKYGGNGKSRLEVIAENFLELKKSICLWVESALKVLNRTRIDNTRRNLSLDIL